MPGLKPRGGTTARVSAQLRISETSIFVSKKCNKKAIAEFFYCLICVVNVSFTTCNICIVNRTIFFDKGDEMNDGIKKAIQYLKARKFIPHYAADVATARDIILKLVPLDAVVGFGDSTSVRQAHVPKDLSKRGNTIINPFEPMKKNQDYKSFSMNVFRRSIEAALCDVYITGTNALTQDGRLVNIDGVGNRVSGMIFGHPVVILVVGRNKIVKDLDAAIERLKKVTAPEHVSRRGSSKSPCIVKGECKDCVGASRVCNITTILEGAPLFSEVNVIIVDEDLGLGWDISWAQERIEKISDRHNGKMWSMPEEAIHALTKEELWAGVDDILHKSGGNKTA